MEHRLLTIESPGPRAPSGRVALAEGLLLAVKPRLEAHGLVEQHAGLVAVVILGDDARLVVRCAVLLASWVLDVYHDVSPLLQHRRRARAKAAMTVRLFNYAPSTWRSGGHLSCSTRSSSSSARAASSSACAAGGVPASVA